MNVDEVVRALRWLARDTDFIFAEEQLNAAADLIESLQAKLDERNKECETQYELLAEKNQQLAASQRRADAAAEEIYKIAACDACKHYDPDDNHCAKPMIDSHKCFEWRGQPPKGDSND